MSQIYKSIASTPSVATTYVCDTGSAVPVANILNVVTDGAGADGYSTSGSGNTITITVSNPLYTITNINFAMSPYTVLSTDQYISVDTSGGAVTINLPNSTLNGRVVTVKDATGDANTNNITMTTPGGVVLIDGSTTYVLNDEYDSVRFIWNSTYYETF